MYAGHKQGYIVAVLDVNTQFMYMQTVRDNKNFWKKKYIYM